MDADAAHGAHFVEAGDDVDADAQLLEHATFQVLQVLEARQVFQALDQAFFFRAGQKQDAYVGPRRFQQRVTPAIAGTGWAGLANRSRGGHGVQS
ncbi:hypothetical protein D3C87_1641810 [compost metagenome]